MLCLWMASTVWLLNNSVLFEIKHGVFGNTPTSTKILIKKYSANKENTPKNRRFN